MMIKKICLILFFILLLLSPSLQANEQNINTLNSVILTSSMHRPQEIDSTEILMIDSIDLKQINDIRTVFEKQNAKYSTPKPPEEKLLRFLKKDELQISSEAMYWARLIRDASYYTDEYATFRDTVIVDPIYLPIIFRGHSFTDKELTFYSMDFVDSKFKKPSLYPTQPLFNDYSQRKKSAQMAIRYVEEKHPDYIQYSRKDIPDELIQATTIKKNIYENLPLQVEGDADFSDVAPIKFIPERQYWKSGFESAIQFSQNYISQNWHKGGSSNLNLFTQNRLTYNYAKNRVAVNNLLEYKTTIYTAIKESKHSYKIGDEVLRLYNDVGYLAFSKWSYTFATEIKSQILKNYKDDTDIKQAAFLAPVTATFGIGMKYAIDKQFQSNKYKKLNIAVNLAPLSYKYMYSIQNNPEEIDLGRHGFKLDTISNLYKKTLAEFGSSIDAQIRFSFNRNVTWESRLNYFTSYENVKFEYENTLIMAISRFFSTRIYLNIRFDDSASTKDDKWKYFQVNELFSFGFNYKW